MTPSIKPTHGPLSAWIATGVFLIVAGAAMLPSTTLISVGIGCIIGGFSVIGAAFMRNRADD